MKRLLILTLFVIAGLHLPAQNVRERILLDSDWQFAFGNATSPEKDFGCGTEYFNYLTKAASIHNEGPYAPEKFDSAKWRNEWKRVNLPHDWVVDLPFAKEASHSHGYKTVGFKYPETSVGWYRKTITIPNDDLGKHIYLQFDGIFRDARVWFNGFYLGHEPSGYATQVYDISEYVNYGGENLICVRADATLEEGWFYEGAGIYRHVWLNKTAPLHIAPFGTFVHSELNSTFDKAELTIETTVENSDLQATDYTLRHVLLAADGSETVRQEEPCPQIKPKERRAVTAKMTVNDPKLWSTDTPYLYRLRTEILQNGKVVDAYYTQTGIRKVEFDADRGFLLNGKSVKLKGVNMHQDHAGVGSAIPDALQEYRIKELKKFGCNAYRSSHNPMTPEMLDVCDRYGMLVIEENRLTGVNEEHIRLLKKMIERDRNHPCIILWSVGNEEWGIEWKDSGTRIAATMREYCHRFDPSRLMCVATSGGPTIVIPADVAGYNYIMQNPVEQHRKDYPKRCALGSEETSGCGTRGLYFDTENEANHNAEGRMMSLNRKPDDKDNTLNRIERGWKFYAERPWLSGLFYWTGFDYRGEPNPMKFPATGSEFGILDYCGFPKDEAYYLKAWWTDEPVLHILPHWNLKGHEGEITDLWVYSNCDEVELSVNGKSLGKKPMPKNGHLAWQAVYKPGSVKAVGYKDGKRILTETVETTDDATQIGINADKRQIKADGRDVAVCRIELLDKKKRIVPTACEELQLTVSGSANILGVGNGDPAWQAQERPTDPNARSFTVKSFNGLAQVLLQSNGNEGQCTLTVSGKGLRSAAYTLQTVAE